MEAPSSPDLGFPATKRRKTSPASSPASSRKGKEKIMEVFRDEEQDAKRRSGADDDGSVNWKTCGICLAEDGQAIRGWIDSCNHYFCFVCIMEWARVESRCPMCKQRFGSIRRTPMPGVFDRERVVSVPVRDQVYHPLVNATTGPHDPYAQVSCYACNSAEDESLLLLCDLCDTAAHTYCVGLGRTVPEGDWYCHDCSILRNDHSNSQVDTDLCRQNIPLTLETFHPSNADIPIDDIVREETGSEELLANRASSHQCQKPAMALAHQEPQGSPSGNKTREQHARTLHRCRDLHKRVKILRENWNALRSGSVSFSSGFFSSGPVNVVKKCPSSVASSISSSQGCFSFSAKSKESIAEGKKSCERLNSRHSADADRAWKMLKLAQATRGFCRGASSPNPAASKGDIVKGPIHRDSTSSSLKIKPFENRVPKDVPAVGNCRDSFIDRVFKGRKHLNCQKQKSDAMLSSVMVSKSSELDFSDQNGEQLSQLDLHRSSNYFRRSNMFPYVSTATSSSSEKLNASSSQAELVSASHCEIGPNKGSDLADQNSEGVLRKVDGAKSEIQSLVKLNLKSLYRDKHLGHEMFKRVARLATHTILAACGLEHSKSHVRSIPSLTCRHLEQPHQFQSSNLVPDFCRDCFSLFVREVVNSIMAET